MNPLSTKLKFRLKVEHFILSLVFMVSLGLVVFPAKAYAAPWDYFFSLKDDLKTAACSPTTALFKGIAEDQPQQSIVRFAYNYDTTRYLKLFYNIFGMSIDNVIRCIGYLPMLNTGLIDTFCSISTGSETNKNVCHRLWGIPMGSTASVNGSLVGLYQTLDAAKTTVSPPANLAYFFNQEFKNVPFVGRALAQTNSYNAPLVGQIYEAWKFVRDIAFGFLALMMLIIGVMMINRTKISSQTIVTLQYALPKIIVSIVLVAFSYPIAAFFTTFFYEVSLGAPVIVVKTIQNTNITEYFVNKSDGKLNFISILVFTLVSIFQIATPFNAAMFLVWGICCVILLIQMIIIVVKWLMTYAKMVVEIVLSPIELALSALPGSEDRSSGETKVIKWFKKLFAYGLSMIVLSAMPALIMWIGLLVLLGGVLDPAKYGVISVPLPALGGIGYGLTLFFFICIMGFSMTSKLPGQIQFMLMGKGPESRR